MTLLHDLIGDGCEEPALFGFADDAIAQPLETTAGWPVVLFHSLEAIIA